MTVFATLELPSRSIAVCRARAADVPAIVDLLTDDALGSGRDGAATDAAWASYLTAFAAIDVDPGQLLVVARDQGQPSVAGRVVATMQMSFIPGLSRRGALRAQIEAVRVHSDLRGTGLGTAMFTWAIDEARRRGCSLVQLTSDKQRTRAHYFYAELGFEASHEGFKLAL